MNVPEMLEAPVKRRDKIGRVTFLLDGQILASYPVLAEQSIERRTFFRVLEYVSEKFFIESRGKSLFAAARAFFVKYKKNLYCRKINLGVKKLTKKRKCIEKILKTGYNYNRLKFWLYFKIL